MSQWLFFLVLFILIIIIILIVAAVAVQNSSKNSPNNSSNIDELINSSSADPQNVDLPNVDPQNVGLPNVDPSNGDLVPDPENITINYHKEFQPHDNVIPSNKINLFMEYYLTQNESRQIEIDFVLATNLGQSALDHLYIITHNEKEAEKARELSENISTTLKSNNVLLASESSVIEHILTTSDSSILEGISSGAKSSNSDKSVCDSKISNHLTIILINNPRPTYGELYTIINRYTGNDDINILANSDIAFDESINKVRKLRKDEALALTRWNVDEYKYPLNGILFENGHWTQDTWITCGKVSPVMEKVNFTTGIMRCDNRIAHILSEEAGYKTFNPCENVKTFHIHKSEIRNYSKSIFLPGTGAFVPVCKWF